MVQTECVGVYQVIWAITHVNKYKHSQDIQRPSGAIQGMKYLPPIISAVVDVVMFGRQWDLGELVSLVL